MQVIDNLEDILREHPGTFEALLDAMLVTETELSGASSSQSELDEELTAQCPVSPPHSLTDPVAGASVLLWHSRDWEVSRRGSRQGRAAAATKKLTFLQLQPQRKVRSL